MSHWSETAMQQANQPGSSSGAPDSAVLDCENRDWEPLADIQDLPDWELQAEINESTDVPGETGSGSSTPAEAAESED